MEYDGSLWLWESRETPLTDKPYSISLHQDTEGKLEGTIFPHRGEEETISGRQATLEEMRALIIGTYSEGETFPCIYGLQANTQGNPEELAGAYHGFFLHREHHLIEPVEQIFQNILTADPRYRDHYFKSLFDYIRGPNRRIQSDRIADNIAATMELRKKQS